VAESALNNVLLDALKPFHPVRVENGAAPGTPDINFVEGWIESKYLDHWPRQGIVKCDHYTPQQRVFAIRRKRSSGNIWFVVQIGKEYLIFDGGVAAEHFGRVDEPTLRSLAIKVWPRSINVQELRDIVSRKK
jgi:hypothetical protein